jgi:hypothetical protein
MKKRVNLAYLQERRARVHIGGLRGKERVCMCVCVCVCVCVVCVCVCVCVCV